MRIESKIKNFHLVQLNSNVQKNVLCGYVHYSQYYYDNLGYSGEVLQYIKDNIYFVTDYSTKKPFTT